MNEEELLYAYEAQLKANYILDHAYYVKPNRTTADRAAYYQRQELAENLSLRFYAELEAKRKNPAGNRDELPTVADEHSESNRRSG